jgi:hypothetical protein
LWDIDINNYLLLFYKRKQEQVEPSDATPNRFWTQEGINVVVSELCHRQSSKCKNNPNVGHDTLSQYGDHFCEIVVISDFK